MTDDFLRGYALACEQVAEALPLIIDVIDAAREVSERVPTIARPLPERLAALDAWRVTELGRTDSEPKA